MDPEVQARFDAAEALWAQGPRSFSEPGIPGVIVKKHGVQRTVEGYPIARMMDTINGPYTHGTREGKPVLIDSAGNTFDPKGRRIIADRRDEERAKGQGAIEE